MNGRKFKSCRGLFLIFFFLSNSRGFDSAVERGNSKKSLKVPKKARKIRKIKKKNLGESKKPWKIRQKPRKTPKNPLKIENQMAPSSIWMFRGPWPGLERHTRATNVLYALWRSLNCWKEHKGGRSGAWKRLDCTFSANLGHCRPPLSIFSHKKACSRLKRAFLYSHLCEKRPEELQELQTASLCTFWCKKASKRLSGGFKSLELCKSVLSASKKVWKWCSRLQLSCGSLKKGLRGLVAAK